MDTAPSNVSSNDSVSCASSIVNSRRRGSRPKKTKLLSFRSRRAASSEKDGRKPISCPPSRLPSPCCLLDPASAASSTLSTNLGTNGDNEGDGNKRKTKKFVNKRGSRRSKGRSKNGNGGGNRELKRRGFNCLDLSRLSRFSPKGERPIAMQLAWLSPEEKECFQSLKVRWECRYREFREYFVFSDEILLRFARFHEFKEDVAWRAMEAFDPRYLSLTAKSLEGQLRTKTLFVVPGLKSRHDGLDVVYMKPSRHLPKKTSTKVVTDNLAYCMNVMAERERASTHGVVLLANMDGWTTCNFGLSYCYDFIQMLQGHVVPVHIRLVLIVDPPKWFGKVWAKMKPMLKDDFRKSVRMIRESDLPSYLEDGYEAYLPDEMASGRADTDEMVSDFITFRTLVEGAIWRQGSDHNRFQVQMKVAHALSA